ncbi:hypothetical protein CC78DRAFT_132130 [Lojkania enalia]|uniref:Uncharacterized protein n=1 Tax=Lojkania enalia TaxID=147567 RepID=A0A9P4NC96_9PLEO|nr:hypothetical protein CC78DRAFT_132130 [Didymosphaeria enalia]
MSELELDTRFVKLGTWTNFDQGPIIGKTITANARTGTLIVALLAVLSTLGTAHLWNLVAFCIHQLRADGRLADALFLQQQALLRTLPPPSTLVADVFKLGWSWRNKTRRPIIRSIPLILLALIFAAATLAASIFSSLVVDSSNLAVLVNSPFCGRMTVLLPPAMHSITESYERQCYGNGSRPGTCNVLSRPRIPIAIQNASCPFNSTICAHAAVSLDSGLQNIRDLYGFNIPSDHSLQIRKKTTCAVLSTEGRTDISDAANTEVADSFVVSSGEYLALYYGSQVVDFESFTFNKTTPTFVNSLMKANVTRDFTFGSVVDFNTGTIPTAYSFQFDPIPELRNNHGDIVLIFVSSNSVLYEEQVNDPLFAADTFESPATSLLSTQVMRYGANDPTRPVGCLEQFQYCHRRTSREDFCTELGSRQDPKLVDTDFPDANNFQRAALRLLATIYQTSDISKASSRFMASAAINIQGVIDSLPNDQWIQELARWESLWWTGTQVSVRNYAVGDPSIPPSNTTLGSNPADDKELCRAYKTKKTSNVVNINVFGLALVITITLLITILDITILKFAIFLTRFRRALAPRVDRWIQDGIWQLQRRAYEARGHGEWINLQNEIPVTRDRRTLSDLARLDEVERKPEYERTFSAKVEAKRGVVAVRVVEGRRGEGMFDRNNVI